MGKTVFDMDHRWCAQKLAAEAEDRLRKYNIDMKDWGYIASRIEMLKTEVIDLEEGLQEMQLAAQAIYGDQGSLVENARCTLSIKQAQRERLMPELTPEKIAKIGKAVWAATDGDMDVDWDAEVPAKP